jgi:hypothetical protein
MAIYHDKPYRLFGGVVGRLHARGGDKFKVGISIPSFP